MRCACGYENEGGNKFCNMCGMALAADGNAGDEPMERAPLDLDLSLEMPELNQGDTLVGVPSAIPLDLSLDGNSDNPLQGLSLDPSAQLGALDLDLGSSEAGLSAAGGMSFESQPIAQGDVSFDLNAAPAGLELGDTPPADVGSEMSFDLSGPDGAGELGLNLRSPNDSGTLSMDTDLGASPAETVVLTPDSPAEEFVLDLGDSSTATSNTTSFDLEMPTNDAPVKGEELLDLGTGTSTSDSTFDFGNLDSAASPVDEPPPPPASITKPVKPPVKPAPAKEPPPADDGAFLDRFLIQPAAPAPVQQGRVKGRVSAPVAEPVPEAESFSFDALDSHEISIEEPAAVEPAAVEPAADEPFAEEPASAEASFPLDVDDDLAGLIMGLEGKTPPKPAPIPKAPAVSRSNKAIIIEESQVTESAMSFDNSSGGTQTLASSLEGLDIPEVQLSGEAFAEEESPETPELSESASDEPALLKPLKLSPEENVEECLKKVSASSDPDERYSLIL